MPLSGLAGKDAQRHMSAKHVWNVSRTVAFDLRVFHFDILLGADCFMQKMVS